MAASSWADTTVTGVRFGSEGERTRIVIDLLPSVDITVSTLLSPPRLVIDMPSVTWQLKDHPQSRPRGFAKGFRYGALDRERSRLVVDLASPVRVSNRQTLPAGQNGVDHARIVIDIVPDEAPQPVPSTEAAASTEIAARPYIPLPRARPERPRASAPNRPEPQANRAIIALDAGHGGIDPGAVAADGTLEKNITLAMARELAELLTESGRYQAFLVRSDDSFIKLRDRIAKARTANADIFISIHADSISDANLRGASIYTLSENASDREAASLAAKENKADIIGGTDLSRADDVLASILIDLSQRSTNNESIKLADLLVDEIGGVTKLVKNTRRFAGFAVLKAPDMPSVLLELGYLSNSSDAERLRQRKHRAELSRAIIQALDQYFGETNGG